MASDLPPLGSRFRSLRRFSGVPAGTTCTVVEHYSDDGFTVEWDRSADILRRGGNPPVLEPLPASDPRTGLRDGFGLDELDALEAIP